MPTGNGFIDTRDWTGVRRVIVPNDTSYPAWLHLNKCGTTAMAHLMRKLPGGCDSFFGHDYPIGREVVCMWRDPFDRIESTYRMYTQQDIHGWGKRSFDYFVRWICRKKDLVDPHMLPMYEIATNKYGRFVPDRVLLWDWPTVKQIYGRAPGVKNHTPGEPQDWSDELRREFATRFELDFMVWDQVLER